MSDAIRILQERFANGEISIEEFNARLAILRETSPTPTAPFAKTQTMHSKTGRTIVESVPMMRAVLVVAFVCAYVSTLIEHGIGEDNSTNFLTYASRLHYGLVFALLVGGVFRMYNVMSTRVWWGFLVSTTIGYMAARALVEDISTDDTATIAAFAAIASVVGSLTVFITLKRLRGAALFASRTQFWSNVLILALLGATFVAIALQFGPTPNAHWQWPGEKKHPIFIIHLPWQLAFAWMLGKALQKDTRIAASV